MLNIFYIENKLMNISGIMHYFVLLNVKWKHSRRNGQVGAAVKHPRHSVGCVYPSIVHTRRWNFATPLPTQHSSSCAKTSSRTHPQRWTLLQ